MVFLDKSVLLQSITHLFREFPLGKRQMLQESAIVALSEDGVAYERVTFPLGHSCSELLFSF